MALNGHILGLAQVVVYLARSVEDGVAMPYTRAVMDYKIHALTRTGLGARTACPARYHGAMGRASPCVSHVHVTVEAVMLWAVALRWQ